MAGMSGDTMNAPPSAALIEFILGRVSVQTNVRSLQRREHGYTLASRTVPDHNLLLCTRGRAEWIIDERPIELSPLSLLIVGPNVTHRARSLTQRVTILSLHVEARLPAGRDLFEVLIFPEVQKIQRGGRLHRFWRGFADDFDQVNASMARALAPAWGRLILLQLIRDTADRGLLGARPLDPLVAEVLQLLTAHIERPINLSELAERTGYSAQHLNRLFRRELGVTPLQHLMRLRLERAGELLLDDRLTVAGVGQAVGFDDPYYFSRVFRQHFGVSPRTWRQASGSYYPSS